MHLRLCHTALSHNFFLSLVLLAHHCLLYLLYSTTIWSSEEDVEISWGWLVLFNLNPASSNEKSHRALIWELQLREDFLFTISTLHSSIDMRTYTGVKGSPMVAHVTGFDED